MCPKHVGHAIRLCSALPGETCEETPSAQKSLGFLTVLREYWERSNSRFPDSAFLSLRPPWGKQAFALLPAALDVALGGATRLLKVLPWPHPERQHAALGVLHRVRPSKEKLGSTGSPFMKVISPTSERNNLIQA